MLDQFVARGGAAGPALALGVETKLVDRRRIDAAETDAGTADLDLVGLADFRHAGDVDGVAAAGQSRTRQASESLRSVIGIPGEASQDVTLADCADKRPACQRPGQGTVFNLTR